MDYKKIAVAIVLALLLIVGGFFIVKTFILKDDNTGIRGGNGEVEQVEQQPVDVAEENPEEDLEEPEEPEEDEDIQTEEAREGTEADKEYLEELDKSVIEEAEREREQFTEEELAIKDSPYPTEEQFKEYFGEYLVKYEELGDKVKSQTVPTLVVMGNVSEDYTREQSVNMRGLLEKNKEHISEGKEEVAKLAYINVPSVVENAQIQELYPLLKNGESIILGTNGLPPIATEEQLEKMLSNEVKARITINQYNYPILILEEVPTANAVRNIINMTKTETQE